MVEPKDTEWVWWPYIPAGNITIVGARGGTGKGVMVSSTAAIITRGGEWPFCEEAANVGNVLWCEAEDTFKTTVIPRLIAAKADCDKVILKKPHEFLRMKDLRDYIETKGIRLIVLSPLNSFLKEFERRQFRSQCPRSANPNPKRHRGHILRRRWHLSFEQET